MKNVLLTSLVLLVFFTAFRSAALDDPSSPDDEFNYDVNYLKREKPTSVKTQRGPDKDVVESLKKSIRNDSRLSPLTRDVGITYAEERLTLRGEVQNDHELILLLKKAARFVPDALLLNELTVKK